MKIFILECTKDELEANRGIMDNIVDAFRGFTNAFFGTMKPCSCPTEQEDKEDEDEDDEG